MDSFDKLVAIRPILERMGMPSEPTTFEVLDLEYLQARPVVKAYPVVNSFLVKINEVFPFWDYHQLNLRIKDLKIDSYYYNETPTGLEEAKNGEKATFDLEELELRVVNPEDTAVLYQHLLQILTMTTYNYDNCNFIVNGPSIEIIVASRETELGYEEMQLGDGFNTYLQYYILNKYFDLPIAIPEGIDTIYDLVFDLIGSEKIGLISSGNPFLLMDELLQYMNYDTFKLIYLHLDNLIKQRHFLLRGSQADTNDEIFKYQELSENMMQIQDLLQLALEKKQQKKRTLKLNNMMEEN